MTKYFDLGCDCDLSLGDTCNCADVINDIEIADIREMSLYTVEDLLSMLDKSVNGSKYVAATERLEELNINLKDDK